MTDNRVCVQRVLPADGVESWTLTDAEGLITPAERFLAHLVAIERSPNTVRAYAHDLRDYFEFLGARGLRWDDLQLEDLGHFIAWLRLPPVARTGVIAVLPSAEVPLSVATVNRKLAALSSFYQFHQRHGVDLGDLVTQWHPGGRSGASWKPFLAHLGTKDVRRRTVKLKTNKRVAPVVSGEQMQRLLAACDLIRDRFLLTLLREAGLRIGEALGLRHEDIDARRCEISVIQRRNANGARAKSFGRQVPVAAPLVRLFSDYLHAEYGPLDSDYVFVSLAGESRGRAMTYPAVYRLVRRLHRETGIFFTPHALRHSYATHLLRRGVAIEIVQQLMGHASIATTADTYSHLDVEDARRALVTAGCLDPGAA